MIIIASPTADSAAATVKINKENSCPYKSSKYTENIIKLRFKLSNTSSTHIKIIKIFLRFITMPTKPIMNKRIFVVNIILFHNTNICLPFLYVLFHKKSL